MADRNSIIGKIKALLAKTTANGATEAEMLSALDKASAMMDVYDITDADVREARDEAAMLRAEPPDLKTHTASSGGYPLAWPNSAASKFFVEVTKPGLGASGCRATRSLQCGCSTPSPTLCSPNCTRI